MSKRKALITGISGQDGAYLANFLLQKNYDVIGFDLNVNKENLWRLQYFGIQDQIEVQRANITDANLIQNLIEQYQPDEIYNLAGISSIVQSWKQPAETLIVNGLAVVNLLDIIKRVNSEIKLFQASSANIYGDAIENTVITEKHIFNPIDPYGVAKLTSHCFVCNYREHYGLFCVNGVLFNHVSPLHSDSFVFKRIVRGVLDICNGKKERLQLGNLDARRDWGFAGDYVEAMWLMLQQEKPNDFIICSGKQHSIRDLARIVFEKVGIVNWQDYVEIDESLVRKKDVDQPKASNEKIQKELNWKPKVDFQQLIQLMIDYEMEKSS